MVAGRSLNMMIELGAGKGYDYTLDEVCCLPCLIACLTSVPSVLAAVHVVGEGGRVRVDGDRSARRRLLGRHRTQGSLT